MKRIRWWSNMLLCFALLGGGASYAQEELTAQNFLPTTATHANWIFSGVVVNESGEHYGYFFQLQREGKEFHATSALFKEESKQLILREEAHATIDDPQSYNWQVGRAFLRFNPINDSWIFGLKTQENKGFNFKVDMLNQSENNPVVQTLRPGVELIVSQTSHLNGHLQIGDDSKEQFVTSKNAWFRQVWLSGNQDKIQPLSGVLCGFNDGSGFYSVNLHEMDALRGAVAGSCDAHGMSTAMSQFINIEEAKDGQWHIRIASPTYHLTLSQAMKQKSVVAGFVDEGARPGFCMLSENILGQQNARVEDLRG